jgi:hypothetical protein
MMRTPRCGLIPLPSRKSWPIFEHYSSEGTLGPEAGRALADVAGYLQKELSALPGRGGRQLPFDAWRELTTPILDTDIMYTELYGEWDENEL